MLSTIHWVTCNSYDCWALFIVSLVVCVMSVERSSFNLFVDCMTGVPEWILICPRSEKSIMNINTVKKWDLVPWPLLHSKNKLCQTSKHCLSFLEKVKQKPQQEDSRHAQKLLPKLLSHLEVEMFDATQVGPTDLLAGSVFLRVTLKGFQQSTHLLLIFQSATSPQSDHLTHNGRVFSKVQTCCSCFSLYHFTTVWPPDASWQSFQ